MYKDHNILAIIPARGGSKRIPRKNIIPLLGKPLIAYSIEAASASNFFDKIIVSTDDPEIAEISSHYGAEVPFIRPTHLATDAANDQDVIRHALQELERQQQFVPDIIVILRPTSPIRKTGLIAQVVDEMLRLQARVVRTVTAVHGVQHPYWMYQQNAAGWAEPFVEQIKISDYYQSQLLPTVYRLNGVVDAVHISAINKQSYLDEEKMAVVEIAEQESIDIDTPLDFKLCETLMQQHIASGETYERN